MAQGLMLTTAETLCAIALRCGLSDQSHFTRLFRRVVGETPYAWRRARRGEIEDHATKQLSDSAALPGEPETRMRN
jgi:AraC-like DNA-binding protein